MYFKRNIDNSKVPLEMTFPFKIIDAYFDSISKNMPKKACAELRIGYGRATTSIFRGFLLGPRRE